MLNINLATRQLEPELMDDPMLDRLDHRQALGGLARAHAFSRTASQIWNQIQSSSALKNRKAFSILDVGCGDGYLLRKIHQLAGRAGKEVSLTGCDFSAAAIEFAREAANEATVPIDFCQLDVLKDELTQADVVINSLFLHHFSERDAVNILQKFASVATELVVVQDLARTKLGYGLCFVATRLLSRSRIVHVDGLLSVKAAFTVAEFQRMLRAAGIRQAKINKHWPERVTIIWPTSQKELL
ncbi:MAG: 2-polyprenyl-3-methyl-5-hydroxy-6-metoxy-1,4-benzoquinol methylase [Mariniblastus sp.]|jgi:2-polyprenyl-3-methyl-5-hydroxy-6-metoxy-1,4-benzoquinol methylase